jgi:UDP-glucose 4-epimerase
MANLAAVKGHPKFRYVRDSVRNELVMTTLVEKADMIYHLAAAVGVQLIVDRPVHTIETNIHGTEVVLALANKFRTPVLVASTSEVYGKSDKVPFSEHEDVVYGSTAFSMVVPRFVQAALKGEPLKVFGSGEQSRCFGCVFDVIEGIIALMATPSAAGKVYNVGSQQSISINGLARKVIEMTGSSSKIEHISYAEAYGKPFDDMMRRVPDLSRIKAAVGYEPKWGLEATLKAVIDYEQGRADTPRAS